MVAKMSVKRAILATKLGSKWIEMTCPPRVQKKQEEALKNSTASARAPLHIDYLLGGESDTTQEAAADKTASKKASAASSSKSKKASAAKPRLGCTRECGGRANESSDWRLASSLAAFAIAASSFA